MCGIAGMIDPRLGREEGETFLGRMLWSIRHRGPDCSSSLIEMPVLLGHNRLSIIDLDERANQPMVYDGLVIVYNGEVYNYVEIRRELEERGYRIRHNLRHRGDPCGLPGMGCRLRNPIRRNVGIRHLGQGERGAVLLARPVRDQALLLHSFGRPFLFRIRVCAPETVAYF